MDGTRTGTAWEEDRSRRGGGRRSRSSSSCSSHRTPDAILGQGALFAIMCLAPVLRRAGAALAATVHCDCCKLCVVSSRLLTPCRPSTLWPCPPALFPRNAMGFRMVRQEDVVLIRSAGAGHPEKTCGQLSDAVLETRLAAAPYSKVACETATKRTWSRRTMTRRGTRPSKASVTTRMWSQVSHLSRFDPPWQHRPGQSAWSDAITLRGAKPRWCSGYGRVPRQGDWRDREQERCRILESDQEQREPEAALDRQHEHCQGLGQRLRQRGHDATCNRQRMWTCPETAAL